MITRYLQRRRQPHYRMLYPKLPLMPLALGRAPPTPPEAPKASPYEV